MLNNMFTIVTLPLVALRAEASESSELVSQLLFGEQIEIIESLNNWYQIRNLSDDYVGYVSKESLNKNNFTETAIDTSHFIVNKTAITSCFKTSHVEKIILPGGCLLPPIENERFKLSNEIYQLAQFNPSYSNESKGQDLIEMATQYMNAPYLWGGKSVFGIDCSGLTQVVFKMVGLQLPRNASQQVNLGNVVNFLSEVRAGDLAFFENEEGAINHVGILVNSHQIIHASGWVKTEIIDSQGIISSTTGEYTHHLRVIKRVI